MTGPICLTGAGVDGAPPTVALDTQGGWFTWTTVNTENKELRHGNDDGWNRWRTAGHASKTTNSEWPLWGHCNCSGVADATTQSGHFVARDSTEMNRWHRNCPLECDPQEGEGGKICHGWDRENDERGLSWDCFPKCIDDTSSRPAVACCADSDTTITVQRCAAYAACAAEDASTDGMSGACYNAAIAVGPPVESAACAACWAAGMVDRPATMCAACVSDYVAVHTSCLASPPSAGAGSAAQTHSVTCAQCQPGMCKILVLSRFVALPVSLIPSTAIADDPDSNPDTPCEPCPPSMFTDSAGETACTPCPSGTLAPAGSTSVASCTAAPLYMGCWDDRETLTLGRDIPTVRKRMGIGNVACQDLVDMLGCAADMSLVSTGLPNGTNISTICPVSCDSCPETVCEDQDAIQYFDDCETLIDCK